MSGPALPPFDAVVLAGGAGRRMGGTDKPTVPVSGRRLVDLAVGSVRGAGRVVVVGPLRPLPAGTWWARESPPGGGPVAGLCAGLARVRAPWVAVLAADLPFLTPAVLTLLRTAARGGAGAVLTDPAGRDQLLVGVWRTAALRAAAGTAPAGGRPLRSLLLALRPARVRLPAVSGTAPPWWDCDTAEDLRRAQQWSRPWNP